MNLFVLWKKEALGLHALMMTSRPNFILMMPKNFILFLLIGGNPEVVEKYLVG